ncbi:DUF2330 domain-containing protein [Mycobacterium sp. CVI_P3]|uniref:DUF2330 domain-containing protein n=1 Tax=Mycobacterium pinniadriaticum TaxID=2994102 RepID=A0ABT3SNE8_9MYCO|nr:DUF2330 domain-containing protein [Mycobacterium pinniadriaticum]MCX2934634.1 DUF2330 domain-containing protein [Mycobacterium pinniadriaticum]MCX2941057.1 DUF2330 domain-containing protein [Mycobacterium pinniadriaticum]
MRRMKMIGVPVLAAGMLVIGPGATAGACACGGIVSRDLDARVTGEQSLVAIDADAETVVMRLDLSSVADNAALIVPTPTPATASSADPGLFPELERLSAPRIEPNRSGRTDLDEAGAVAAGGPTVVARVQLGPLEATTLTGGDLAGVQRWLDAAGYTMRPEVTAQLDPYLKQGWSFVAMRLTGQEPLSGQLDPVRLDFASDELVYPMRMSAAAKDAQRVVVYTLAQHRMERTDADAAAQDVSVDYAGPIQGRTTDPVLTELSSRNPYLTRISTTISEPSSVTTDFVFGPAPTDDPYQRVIRQADATDDVGAFVQAVAATVVVIIVAAAVGVIWTVRQRRSVR